MTSTNSPHIFFHEDQAFRKSGLFTALLAGSGVSAVVGFLVWLNAPSTGSQSTGIPLFALAIGAVAVLAILFLVLGSRLTTEVNRSGLYIQYFPFHLSPKKIPLENVVQIEIKTYKPLRDYGGLNLFRCLSFHIFK